MAPTSVATIMNALLMLTAVVDLLVRILLLRKVPSSATSPPTAGALLRHSPIVTRPGPGGWMCTARQCRLLRLSLLP